ncbi:unnamed protein product [Rotaria sp. Silwood2]|nr:unnamed protein product [Rotaria sp. Silwood2]CAF3945619.1 unnamed protein product [Rotaria sp. Silwood2]
MHRFIFFILCFAIIHLNYACYITNCPIGGKRNLQFDNNLRSHQCPQCGLTGQCFGPSICCTSLACRIGHQSDIRQCSMENRHVIPCEIKTPICSAVPNGRCAANGVCCGTESCQMDKNCIMVSNQESDSSREERLSQPEIILFE